MRRAHAVLAAIVAVALATSCSDDAASAASPAGDAGAAACDAGERPGDDGFCAPFTTAADCEPGTRPAIGSDACVPVGTTTCAAGFERDPSGWGCAPILPSAPCAGATRPALGERACVPVGDCSAAYPPNDAIVVDPSLAPGAVDGTHVRTINEGLAAAPDGAVLALVDGTHELAAATVSKRVTLVGRCAAKARIVPAAGATSGLRFLGSAAVRGVTMEGIATPLEGVNAAANVTVEDVVVDRARYRAVLATRSATFTLRRVVVRGTEPRSRSEQTVAVLAGTRSKVALEACSLENSVDAAVAAADDPGTHVTMHRTVVDRTVPRPDGKSGGAVRAFEGAHLDITESAILRSTGIGVLALRRDKPPPEITLVRSVVKDTTFTTETGNELGTAVNAGHGGIIRVEGSTIANTESIGVYSAATSKIALVNSVITGSKATNDVSGYGASAHEGEISLVGSAIVGASALGVGGHTGAKITIERSLVRDVGGDVIEGLPLGMALHVTAASSITAKDTALVNAEIGAMGGNPGTTLTLEGVVISRTSAAPKAHFGHGVLAVAGTTITISRSIVERQPGVALFFAGGGGVASRSVVRANGVGAHAQEGSSLVEAAVLPDVPPELELVVASDIRFVENGAKTGSGELPLPVNVAPPPGAP